MSIVTSLKRGLQNGCGTMKNEGIPNQILPASCPCKVAGVVLCFHLLYTCSLFVVATKEQTKCFTRGHQQNSWMRCWCKTTFSLRNFCVACDFSTFARSWSQILDKRHRHPFSQYSRGAYLMLHPPLESLLSLTPQTHLP